MSLVRWLRKNNKKIMAVVVIVIMVGFIGGSYIQQLSRRAATGRQTVAYFADDQPITNYDLAMARRGLEVLKMLRTDDMLRSLSVPLFRTRDLHALLLGELLFADRTTSPALVNYIKQIRTENQYRISDKQINDIYNRSMSSDVYWLLLKNEARRAGVKTSDNYSKNQLARTIPQIAGGATYKQVVGSIVNQSGLSEQEILTTFSELLAVLNYAKILCTTEDITDSQIMHDVSYENERIDLEFVSFDSAVFADDQPEPTHQEISEQFDKYKQSFAGDITEQNPYGFGYKLPDRVRLEYIAVNLDDISTIVTPPTHEEAEEYYQRYREQLFTEQVPLDPNDPNSMTIDRTRSYAEVAATILRALLLRKINSKAERILQEAKTLTEAAFGSADTDLATLGAEQFKQLAGDYEIASGQLSEKYNVDVYSGKTGLLSADDIRTDRALAALYLPGYGYNPVALARLVFAVDELTVSELGPFEAQKPSLYQNIGPLRDMSAQMTGQTMGQIMVLVRVIEAKKAAEPESIDQSFSTSTLVLEQTPEQAGAQDVYAVKQQVVKDLKRLAAMDTAKRKAEEFLELATKDGWDSAVDKFNELYGRQEGQDQSSAETFRLQSFTDLRRIPDTALETIAVQNEGDPTAMLLLNERKRESILRERIYSLIPQDSNTVDSLPLVLELKPSMSYYCLKNVSVKRLYLEDYQRIKAMRVYKEDFVRSQSLAPVHFNPESILTRMDLRLLDRDDRPLDVNTPPEPKGKL
jgi:hypothetical protein